MYKVGFDNNKYLQMQSERIKERINEFGGKLYLEFGGKLFDDYHASRVLPGFQPDSKLQMLLQLKEQAEIVIVISASDIEKNKIRGDLGITYSTDVLRLVNAFEGMGLMVGSVVLTKYVSTPRVNAFEQKLKDRGIPFYHHYLIDGYPANISKIVSDEGYGRNEYIAPGPGSGKMATCLSQLYHENKRGIKAGYAKFETFPIWNIALKHPVNIAYEAATADLNDVNMIDPWHLEAYGGNCIFDDEAVKEAANQEIIRRFFNAKCNQIKGRASKDEIYKLELLMNNAGLCVDDRKCALEATKLEEKTGAPAAAIELSDGKTVTGKTSALLGCASAMLLNALKVLAGIDDDVLLIAPEVIKPIQELKINHLGNKNPRLHTDETLIALSISAVNDEKAKLALNQISKLKNCEMHSSVMLAQVDENVLKKLGIRLTCSC